MTESILRWSLTSTVFTVICANKRWFRLGEVESDYDSAHLLALFWNGEFVDLPEVKWHSELRVFTTVQSAVGNSIRECAVLQHRHILFYLRSWNRTVPRYSGGNLLVWGLRLATRLVVPHWVENTDIHLLVLPNLQLYYPLSLSKIAEPQPNVAR